MTGTYTSCVLIYYPTHIHLQCTHRLPYTHTSLRSSLINSRSTSVGERHSHLYLKKSKTTGLLILSFLRGRAKCSYWKMHRLRGRLSLHSIHQPSIYSSKSYTLPWIGSSRGGARYPEGRRFLLTAHRIFRASSFASLISRTFRRLSSACFSIVL